MKRLTALLLALTLLVALPACSDESSSTDLADTYIAELREIYDAADVESIVADPEDEDPFRPGDTYTDRHYAESGGSSTLEYVSLTYHEININEDTYDFAARLYNTIYSLHGEPIDPNNTLLTELFSRGWIPWESAYYSASWQLSDRRLTLSVRYTYDATPASVELALTLRPNSSIPEPTAATSTAP